MAAERLRDRPPAIAQAGTPISRAVAPIRLARSPQQKTPRRGGGALLRLLQGGEICISIYVDPWEVGEPRCVAGARCGKHRGPYERRRTRPESFLICSASASSRESLNSV